MTGFAFAKRRLEQASLIDCLRIKGMKADLTVPIEAFDAIYLWFLGLTRLVVVLLPLWNQVNLLDIAT